MHRLTSLVFVPAITVAMASSAGAQTPPLARFVPDLLASAARVDSRHLNDRADFVVPLPLVGVLSEINRSLGVQLATFPFDAGLRTPAPGVPGPSAQLGLAPMAAAHGIPMSRGRMRVGFQYQNTSFGSWDGFSLDSGNLATIQTPRADLLAEFGPHVLQQSMSLRLQRDTVTFSMLYGAGDRFDIGVAVPIVHIQMEGQVRSQLFKLPQGRPDTYFFDVYPVQPTAADGCSTSAIDVPGVNHAGQGTVTQPIEARFDMVELEVREVTRRCTANGLGDVAVQSRYRFGSGASALTLYGDLRLPTGNADHLLGTGALRATAAVGWAGAYGRVTPHATAGYTHSVGDASSVFNTLDATLSPQALDLTIPREIAFGGGVDVVVVPGISLTADLLGRHLTDLRRFTVADSSGLALGIAGVPPVAGPVLVPAGTGATIVTGVFGARVSLSQDVGLKTSLILPVTGAGLRPRVGLGVGLVYQF